MLKKRFYVHVLLLIISMLSFGCTTSSQKEVADQKSDQIIVAPQKKQPVARKKTPAKATVSTSQAKEFELWKKEFKAYAEKQGLKSSFLTPIVADFKLLPNVLRSDRAQGEFVLTFWDYTDRTLSDTRIQKGREMMDIYSDILQQVSQKYGVQPHFLIAFWGLETNYGSYKGHINTLDALATLSFDKRRRKFFTNELITLLKIIQKGEKTQFQGSWAGAFGNFQFMPTTYAAYAVDGDGDGQRDIINSMADSFHSAANYLSKMGWESESSWGREVTLPAHLDWDKVHKKGTKTVSDWNKMGIVPACGINWPKDELSKPATLVMPMGTTGPVFLTYRNYKLTMRWNNSSLYALSVGLLSDMMVDKDARIYAKRTNPRFSRKEVEFVQQKLKDLGYYEFDVDGSFGTGSRRAVKEYQKDNNMKQDGYLSKELLKKLKEEN